MRTQWLALAGALVLGTPLSAQTNPPAGTPQAADPATQQRLDGLLNRWENEMKAIQTLVAQCNRTTVNKTFGTTDTFEGTASFMKPNMAMLQMEKKGRKDMLSALSAPATRCMNTSRRAGSSAFTKWPRPRTAGWPRTTAFCRSCLG